ncbi:alpha/beta hydrolase [Cyanobium sp. Alchichica 3B3-8F6]|uniref:alpha/beta hydrolase n=1 Tax=Cyanobium sp. Alchichica 3B3-8F6 TaxID=2823696 RepID=UPI0020CCFE41|nr:alpha/beta hydrolase [Cyanobium sp. Alchichica 3B3-8F6]
MERWRWRERWRWSWSWRLAFLLAGCSLAGAPASAAQRVTARLGELERSVAVPALADFARTGAINPDLRFFLDRLKPVQREDLRTALSQLLPVTTVMVANFLSTAAGGAHSSAVGEGAGSAPGCCPGRCVVRLDPGGG